jgi:uncharacterized protein DUF3562
VASGPGASHQKLIGALAAEFQLPPIEVERIYADTLNELQSHARIVNFLPVLAVRRAKLRLSAIKKGESRDRPSSSLPGEAQTA